MLVQSRSAHLVVVSSPSSHEDAIPDIKGVHHEEVDDGFQKLLQSVAEAEGEGQHQRAAGQPCPVQVHLHTHAQTILVITTNHRCPADVRYLLGVS